MANSKIVWVGQDANLRIDQIQPATESHISKYVFYSAYTGLTGVGELTASSTAVHAQSAVSSSKTYPITSYLLYSHKFAGGTAFATSNKVVTELTVRQPLNETSLRSVSMADNDYAWSNEKSKVFHISPTFVEQYQPYSKACIIKSDSTDKSAKWGSIPDYTVEELNENIDLQWDKTTAASTDLGTESHNIIINIQSRANISAATTRTIDNTNVRFLVKNAVTALSGLTNKALYAGSSAVTETVKITPVRPFSDVLLLVDEHGSEYISGNSITSEGGAKVSLSGQDITFDASEVGVGTAQQTIKFKVRSKQSASPVDTGFITFTVNAVTNITGKTVVEGQIISVSPGIGAIHTAEITQGSTAISISKSGETLNITGLGVDVNTDWSITVTNAAGAHITISGTTTILEDASASINTGDYIIIGTDTLTGLGASITEIITQPSKGEASLEGGKLKYEASTTNSPIAAGTYAIKVKGANGATQTVNIVVSNITATLS